MFARLKAAHKLSGMSSKWLGATGSAPPHNDQILSKAMEYVQNLGLHPEDAWLLTMTNYIIGHPDHDTKRWLAGLMLNFLTAHEGRIPLSADSIMAAKGHAREILYMSCPAPEPAVGSKSAGAPRGDKPFPTVRDGDRAITECPQCRQRLRVPFDRRIRISCSVCHHQFEFGPYFSDAEREYIRARLNKG